MSQLRRITNKSFAEVSGIGVIMFTIFCKCPYRYKQKQVLSNSVLWTKKRLFLGLFDWNAPIRQCCIVLVLHINCINADDIESTTVKISQSKTVRRCSDYLSDLLDKLCSNSFKIVKREVSLLEILTPKELRDHMNKQRLLSNEKWRRVRRQIASECCDQQCTWGNLVLYCPAKAKLVLANPDFFNDYT